MHLPYTFSEDYEPDAVPFLLIEKSLLCCYFGVKLWKTSVKHTRNQMSELECRKNWFQKSWRKVYEGKFDEKKRLSGDICIDLWTLRRLRKQGSRQRYFGYGRHRFSDRRTAWAFRHRKCTQHKYPLSLSLLYFHDIYLTRCYLFEILSITWGSLTSPSTINAL